ncbi:MAG: O-phosphoserine--tRNA ligase, partial [Archaeoglobales archaeon]
LFPEFKELKPTPTNLTLRSHMTTSWFITLSKIVDKLPLPIKLFSIDRCFRREQGESSVRLYSYFSASCVFVDEDVDVEDGKAIATALLRYFGFERFKFKLDEKRSKYYIPGTQTEVFVHHPKLDWVEIATFGVYSPTALCQYNIDYPVLNLGLGVERLAMILYGYTDVRKMVYIQDVKLSDLEIARAIRIREVPRTSVGLNVADAIVKTAEIYADERSPCEFLAFEGELYGRRFRVYLFEFEEDTKLCGPAYANEIVVYRNSIYGIPRNERFREYFEGGVSTRIRYIDSFAYYVGSRVEEMVARGGGGILRIRVVEGPGDVNLDVHENVVRYVTSRGGKIDVRGPMFVNVRVAVESNEK